MPPSTKSGASLFFFSHSEQEKLNNVKNEKKITNIIPLVGSDVGSQAQNINFADTCLSK